MRSKHLAVSCLFAPLLPSHTLPGSLAFTFPNAPPRRTVQASPPPPAILPATKKPMSEWTEEEKRIDRERGEKLLKVKGGALAVGLIVYLLLQQ